MNRRYIRSHRGQRRRRNVLGTRPVRILILIFVIAVVSAMAYSTCKKHAADARANEALAGTPDIARLTEVITPGITDGRMIHYPGFNIYFSPTDHQPYYGAWIITAENAKNIAVKRTNNFREDPDIPQSATPADYRGSGYDRGHIVPAADCRYSTDAMNACFFMTNMSPQINDLNSKAWSALEDNCRNWAIRDSAIIVIAGPVLSDYLTETIGKNNVTVPDRFFKVVLAPYADPPRAIGFIMENRYIDGGVQTTAVSVNQVESITGFDFFSVLPDDVEETIESESNYASWQRKQRKNRR